MEIKPCPWCGGDDIDTTSGDDIDGGPYYFCTQDGCVGDGLMLTPDAWNALPRQEPWQDAPDCDGPWWVWHGHMNEPTIVYLKKTPQGMVIVANWHRGLDSPISLYPGWKWQRAQVPPPPEEKP